MYELLYIERNSFALGGILLCFGSFSCPSWCDAPGKSFRNQGQGAVPAACGHTNPALIQVPAASGTPGHIWTHSNPSAPPGPFPPGTSQPCWPKGTLTSPGLGRNNPGEAGIAAICLQSASLVDIL